MSTTQLALLLSLSTCLTLASREQGLDSSHGHSAAKAWTHLHWYQRPGARARRSTRSGEPLVLPLARDFRQLPAGQEGGPARELRVLQQPLQLPGDMVGSTTRGAALHPSDLPAAPAGRFVSPEELQYLEDEATAIMEELEAKENLFPEGNTANGPAGGERGPARGLRVIQRPVQQSADAQSFGVWSPPPGSVLNPADLPPTPPGRFVSPEELQYLEDEATSIMEELEARKLEKETEPEQPNNEQFKKPDMEGGQQTVKKRTRNMFRFRIVPNLQFWDRKGKRSSSPNFVPMMG